jgi:multiple sugar transport system permease protein
MVVVKRKLIYKILVNILKYMVGIIALLLFSFPILWVIKSSFSTPIDAITLPPVWIFKPTLSNYISIFNNQPFGRYLANSLIISSVTTVIVIIIGLPAAYAIARYKFRGKANLGFWIISIFMFPPIAAILPYLLIYGKLGIQDSLLGVILPHVSFTLPISIWLLQRFIREIPFEIEESAIVDGAGLIRRIKSIIFPLIIQGLVTTAIFAFLFSWNDYIWALMLAPVKAKTLPVATSSLIAWASINWAEISAAIVVIVFPIIILILIVRKYLLRGFTFGLK